MNDAPYDQENDSEPRVRIHPIFAMSDKDALNVFEITRWLSDWPNTQKNFG